MKTEDLIATLSADTLPRPGVGGRLARALGPAVAVSAAALVTLWNVRPDLAAVGTRLKVKIQLREWDAVVTEDSPFDPTNARIRIDG